MNNIKSLIAALAFAGLTACADNTPKTFSGFITDASMNTVTVRALTDESTCTFATTDYLDCSFIHNSFIYISI